jgi:hypothetical protein
MIRGNIIDGTSLRGERGKIGHITQARISRIKDL